MCRAVSSTSWSRRGLLAVAGTASACGFRPLYGPEATSGETGDLQQELAAVRVGGIPDRFGQVLRRELERRFEGAAPGTAARYALAVEVSFGAEPLGYRRDGAITRLRYTASGQWVLSTLAVPPQRVAASAIPFRTLDSFNIPDLQFFAADSARDAMELRLADVISEEVTRQVAMALRRRRGGGAV